MHNLYTEFTELTHFNSTQFYLFNTVYAPRNATVNLEDTSKHKLLSFLLMGVQSLRY